MSKNNSLVMTVVAVAILIVMVVGATFAYFASTNTITATANLNVTTQTAASFTSSAGTPLSLNITADKMLKSETSDADEPLAAEGNTTLTVNLTAAVGTTCTYDITYTNTGDQYTPVAKKATNHQFEFEVDGSSNKSGEKTMAITSYGDLTAGTSTVISGASISVTTGTAATPVVWTFNARFYNLNAAQATEKNYGGYFKVANVLC